MEFAGMKQLKFGTLGYMTLGLWGLIPPSLSCYHAC